MKFKDCMYYSKKISIGKKSEIKSTIFGFVISCILLSIFLIFASLIIHIETSIVSDHNVESLKLDSFDDNEFISNNSKYIEEKVYYSENGVEFNITKDGFNVKDVAYPVITIDGHEKIYKDIYKYGYENLEYKILAQTITCFYDDSFYLESEKNYMKKNNLGDLILAGNKLTSKEKEIMISSYLLDYFGIDDYSSVIGKKISFYNQLPFGSIKYGHIIDEEFNDETNEILNQYYYVFKNFKIVGVFNSNIYLCPSRFTDCDVTFEEYLIKSNSNFWVSANSVKKYEYCYYSYIDEKDNEHINFDKYCFSCDLPSKLKENDDKVQLLCNLNNSKDLKYIVQFKSINDAYDFVNICENEYILNGSVSYITNADLNSYFFFYPYFEFIKIIIFILVLVILLLVFINIIRIMDYSLQSNIEFFAIMNYLGLDKKDLRKIYLTKNSLDYLKSILITVLILIPIEIVTSFFLNKIYVSQFRGIFNFNIPIYLYILSIIIPIIIIYILICLISITIVHRYTNLIKKMRIN